MLRYRFKNSNITKNSHWVKMTLEQCCNCYDSQRIPVSEKNRIKGAYPYYGANGIQDYINDYIFDGEYILLAEDGGHYTEFRTRPIAQFVTGKFWVNNHAHILQAKDEFNNKFIFYCLEHKNIIPDVKGSTRGKLNKSDMWRIKISIPSNVKEQQKIADFLSAVDNQIEIQRQRVNILELQKKGLLDKVFSQELRFKQDDGNDYPDWEDTIVSKGIEVVTDFVAAGSFADLRNNVEYINNQNYAQLVRTTDLKNNFQLESQVYVNKHAFKYLYRVNLDKPSIVLPNVGVNCGEVYYIVPENLPYKNNVLGPNAILLHSESNNNKYLSCYFMCKDFQSVLKGITGYGAKSKFNKTALRKIRIKLPVIKEQQKIASFFTAIDNQIDIEKQRLTTMETIKKGLLQQMFM